MKKNRKPNKIVWTNEEVAKTDFLVFRESITKNVTNVVAPNGLQVGLFDEDFVANLNVTGAITGSRQIYSNENIVAKLGFTGSLQKTFGGQNFLQAGSNVTVTNNANGTITIASSAGALNNLTTGDGLQLDSGATYNGSAARTISLDLKSNGGLKIDSTELSVEPADFAGSGLADDGSDNLKIDIPNQTNVTAATGDYVLIADASDSYNLKRTTVGSIQSLSSIDIAGLSSSLTESTLATGDLLAIADVNDSNTVKKMTIEDLGQYLASGTNSGIGEASGKLKLDANDLSAGAVSVSNDSFAFIDSDDNETKKETIADLVTAIRGTTTTTGLSSASGVLNIDITNQGTTTLASNDELLVYDIDASALKKTTVSDIQSTSISLNGLSAAVVDVANDSFAFIDANDSNNSKKESLSDLVSAVAGDGLAASSGVLALDLQELTEATVTVASDYIPIIDGGASGTSRKESISDLVSAIASTGLSVSSGQISVNFGSASGTVVQGNNTLTINAGDGLTGGGSATLGSSTSLTLDINPEDFAGTGINASGDDLHAYLQAGSNVTITTGSEGQLVIAVASGGGGGSGVGTMDSFTVAGDSGSNQTITDSNTLTLAGGTGISSTASATDTVTFAIDNSIVATISGSSFSGAVRATQITGSITKLNDGTTAYIQAGNSNTTIATGSAGQILISSTDTNTQLTQEQVEDFVGGMLDGTETGISVSYDDTDGNIDFVVSDTTVAGDSGSTGITPGDTLTIAGGTNVTTVMSGDTLTITATDTNTQLSTEEVQDIAGPLVATGGTKTGIAVTYDDANGNMDFVVSDLTVAGDSGSTGMTPGDTLTIAGGTNVTTAMSGDTLTITATDTNTQYTAGDGLDLGGTEFSLDLKSNSGLVIDSTELTIDDSIIATITGSTFSGTVKAPALTGSLTKLQDGTSYLIAGSNVTITTGSSGAVTIASSGGGGGSLTAAQTGGSSFGSTSTLNFSGSTVVNNGGGAVTVTPVIGAPEDGTYTDGLFTDFDYSTLIGTAIDRFNEVLKALAPTPAPDLDDIDCNNSSGTTALLSFGPANDQSSASPAYASSATAAGFSAVDVNGSYAAATSGNNIRKGIYDGTVTISGDLNEDVSQNLNGGEVNFVANSFGNADTGTLKLEVNGSVVHSVNLTLAASGNGVPGAGSSTQVNGNSSGFINLSQTGSATLSNGDPFPSFQHRTGKYQVGTSDQRNGWNYARVIHTIGSTDITTNYVEWINDPNADALSASGNNFSEIGLSGSIFISGIQYNTSASAIYKVKVDNAYKYVHDSTNITFTTSNGAIAAQSKPTIGGSEDHTKALHLTGNLATNTTELLNGTVSAAVNVTHPMKSNLSSGGSTSATGFLIFNVSNSSTDLQETFTKEDKRLVSASYNAMGDVSGGSYDWNPALHLSGAANQTDGLIFYNHRLYSAINTLNSGDFRRSSQGGSLNNGPINNPNYSGLSSGIKTFFRAFKNTGSSARDLNLTIVGNSTTIVNFSTALNSGRIRVLTKIPGKTSWMDIARSFSYQTSSYGAGASHTFDSSISGTSTNVITFGTETIATNEYVVFAIEADASWNQYLDTMTVSFPAAGTINAAPTLDDIDCNDTGVAGNLSFGSSKSIAGYTNHGAGAGFSAVDINGLYQTQTSSNNLKRALFAGATVIDGELNEDVGSTVYYAANAFDSAHTGSLKLEVNGSVIHTLDLYAFAFSGNSLNGNSSGFKSVIVPTNPVDSSGIPDYTKWYRTASFQVGTADQRNGWNYARIIHSIAGESDRETNYVEWINDSDSNALATSNAAFSFFGSSALYFQSGVKYFVSPTGSLAFTVDNCYRNVYSDSNSAVSMGSLSNFSVTNVAINGLGVTNSSTAASSVSLPALDTSATNPHTLPIHVTASVSFSRSSSIPSSSIAGGTQYNGSLASTVLHPLKSNGSLSSQTKSNFLVFSGSNSSDLNNNEYFVQEVYRIQSGTYTSQASTTGTPWNSSISMNDNGNYPTYATGLLIYNSKLISPKKGPVNGDFRDFGQGGDLTSPSGNPNYSSLTNATRHYIRYFKNNTSTDTPQVTITIRGDANIVARAGASAGSLGANKNVFVEAKIPGKTGWMDTARASAGSGNISDGDGALSGGLDATIDSGGATNICTFNGQTVNGTASSPEFIIISVVADDDWTGYISRITVAYS